MMCYRDMEFCNASCRNVACLRHPANIPKDSEGHYDTHGLLIAFNDYTKECDKFLPIGEDDARKTM